MALIVIAGIEGIEGIEAIVGIAVTEAIAVVFIMIAVMMAPKSRAP
jgi:hypothetical protein